MRLRLRKHLLGLGREPLSLQYLERGLGQTTRRSSSVALNRLGLIDREYAVAADVKRLHLFDQLAGLMRSNCCASRTDVIHPVGVICAMSMASDRLGTGPWRPASSGGSTTSTTAQRKLATVSAVNPRRCARLIRIPASFGPVGLRAYRAIRLPSSSYARMYLAASSGVGTL